MIKSKIGEKTFNLFYEFYSLNNMRQLHILFNSAKTWDCLLIFVFLPEFTIAEPKIVLFWYSKQF